ncbi:MAG: flagellar biosynthesis anti-sigma factor FlgM [Magnetococcales bacterium]|nr:flagellar biosynthesis anti-sigma factor FlgM [Magnetococcales bacterium]
MKVKGLETAKLNRMAQGGRARATTATSTAGGSSAAAHASSNQATAAHEDDVALSAGGRIMASAGEVVQQTPEIRVELVESIREALAAGRYTISSLDIADRILRQVLLERKRYSG